MSPSAFQRAGLLSIAFALTQFPVTASACTACMGDPTSKVAGAMNSAIFLMLGCIGAMLASLGGFALYLMKRAGAPLPPHLELTESIADSEDPNVT